MDDKASNISQRRKAAHQQSSPEYRERRRELIETAAAVFGERGFDKSSIQHIADALGTDRASVYYYVASKEELFTEVVSDAVRENVETVEQIRTMDASPTQKVQQLIESLMLSYEEHYPYLYVWVQEDMSRLSSDAPSSALRALARRYTDAVASIVEEAVDTGEFRNPQDPRLVAYGIIGMLNWTHRWYKPDGHYEASEIARTFSSMVLNGLMRSDDMS